MTHHTSAARAMKRKSSAPSTAAVSLGAAYQPGDLSLLLNPAAAPDVYVPPAIAPSKQPRDDDDNDNDDESDVDEDGGDDSQFDGINVRNPEADLGEDDDEIIDDSALYADMDESTIRLQKRVKRVREDHEAEQLSQPRKRREVLSKANDERLPRTLFVGNVPVATTKTQLQTAFKSFGAIESFRFRSFAPADPAMPRKAIMINKAFHEKNSSMNAYIVYESEESIEKALAMNGRDFHGNTLRVDFADHSKTGSKVDTAIFIGNLPFDVQDDELRTLFDQCGDIDYVRCVRDPKVNIGKGFAFIGFTDAAAVKKALSLNGAKLKGRELRVTRAMDEQKLTAVKEKRDRALKEKLSGTNGAARRVDTREKHAKRKLEAQSKSANGGDEELAAKRVRRAYQGETSDPKELVRKQRRLDKKERKRDDIKKQKESLVKTKSAVPRTASTGKSNSDTKKSKQSPKRSTSSSKRPAKKSKSSVSTKPK